MVSAFSSTGPREIAARPRTASGLSPLRRMESSASTNSALMTVKSPASSAARRRSDAERRPPRRMSSSVAAVPSGHSQGGVSFKIVKFIVIPRLLHR